MLFSGIDNLELGSQTPMSPLGKLLRYLLVVTFCLEANLSLLASSAMAPDHGRDLVTADQIRATGIDQDCEDDTSHDERGAATDECDCGAGCMCVCVFPVVAIIQTVPFAVRHSLSTQPAVRSRPPVALAAITRVFRPPIG